MQPPKDAKIIDWPTSIMWFDEYGILYSIPKPGARRDQTREESQKQMEEFRRIVKGKKTCMITQSDNSGRTPKKEDRDWIAKELETVIKAMAIVSASPVSRMVANLFFGFKPPTYPVKFFANETEAKEWIQKYV